MHNTNNKNFRGYKTRQCWYSAPVQPMYSYGWYYAYISVNTRLDGLDIVPSCSLSILMVGIMLIFPCIRDSIVLIQCPRQDYRVLYPRKYKHNTNHKNTQATRGHYIKTIEARINGNISIIQTIRILRLHEGATSRLSSLVLTEI